MWATAQASLVSLVQSTQRCICVCVCVYVRVHKCAETCGRGKAAQTLVALTCAKRMAICTYIWVCVCACVCACLPVHKYIKKCGRQPRLRCHSLIQSARQSVCKYFIYVWVRVCACVRVQMCIIEMIVRACICEGNQKFQSQARDEVCGYYMLEYVYACGLKSKHHTLILACLSRGGLFNVLENQSYVLRAF